MTTGTNTIANFSPTVPVVDGGFGAATYTAYSLLATGTTTTGNAQSAGTGTSGQAYVSGGAGTLGTWIAPNLTGCWQYIASATASASASIAFTGLTTSYYAYKIFINDASPTTSEVSFEMLTSSNNGVSYDNSAGNYQSAYIMLSDLGTAAQVDNSQAYISLGLNIDNANVAGNYEITLINPATSLANNGFFTIGSFLTATNTNGQIFIGHGIRNATQVNNAIKFAYSSGTINKGTFEIYGILV